MKRLIFCAILLASLLICVQLLAPSIAAQDVLPDAQTFKETIAKSMELKTIEDDSQKKVIQCFAVRNDGWFAVGHPGNTIYIYDQNGNYQYGYQFYTGGADYGIAFSGDNLAIYLLRGETIAVYNAEGVCISAKETRFSKQIIDDVRRSTSKKIADTQYILERDIGLFWDDYSRLVKIDEQGKHKVLYDATTAGYAAGLLQNTMVIGCIISFVGACVFTVKKNWNGLEEHSA